MQKKIIAILLALVILSSMAIVAGQVNAQTTSTNARPIKIGLVAPVSKSPVGQDMNRAAELAVQQINDAGGIYVSEWNTNVNIDLVLADTIDDSPGNAVSGVTR